MQPILKSNPTLIMNSNVISLALTAYALYSAIASKPKLNKLDERVVDIIDQVDDLTTKVDDLTTKIPSRINQDIDFTYTLILGRPSDMNKLSGALHFSIRNKSDKNTYIVNGFQLIPTVGAGICNSESSNLLNMRIGVTLKPGDQFNGRLSYNNLNVARTDLGAVNQKLLDIFNKAFGWTKLGDDDKTVNGACEADLWLNVSAPYLNPNQAYVVEKFGVKGDLRWHGGNYLPGNPKTIPGTEIYYNEYGTVMGYHAAAKFFGLE